MCSYLLSQIRLYEPQSAGINVQLSQSESTPRRLTLLTMQSSHIRGEMNDKRPSDNARSFLDLSPLKLRNVLDMNEGSK